LAVASLLVRVGADIADFEKNMGGVAGGLESVGKSATQTGKTLTKGLTLPLVGMATMAIKSGADFQEQMAVVQAVSGATADEFEALTDEARRLGIETEFSAEQVAGGMEFMSRAGWSATEQMTALTHVLDLATADNMSLAESARITSDIMAGFSLEAEEAGRVADILAKTSATANIDVAGLGEAMSYSAPIASTLGIGMEETATAIAVMADSGIKASRAGRLLGTAMTRMVAPTDAMQETIKTLGLDLEDASGEFVGINELTRQWESATEDMTGAQKASHAQILFGQNAMGAMLQVLDAGADELDEYTLSLINSEGHTKSMAEVMRDTLNADLKVLLATLQDVGISFFEIVEPAISTVIDSMIAMAKWVGELDETTMSMVIAFGALLASIGPVLLIAGKLIDAFTKVAPIIAKVTKIIGLLASPAGVVFLLIGAIAILIATNEEFRAIAIEVFNSVLGVINSVWQKIEPILSAFYKEFSALMNTLLEEGGKFIAGLEPIFDRIKPIIDSVLQVLQPVFDSLMLTLESFLTVVLRVFQGVIDAVAPLSEAFYSYVNAILDGVEIILAIIQGDFAGAWELAESLFAHFDDFVHNMLRALLAFIGGIFGVDLIEIITTSMQAVDEFITETWSSIEKFTSDVWQGIVSFFAGIWQEIVADFDKSVNAVKVILEFMESTAQTIWDSVEGIFDKHVKPIIETVTELGRTVERIFKSMSEQVTKRISALTQPFKDFGSGLSKLANQGREFLGLKSDDFISRAFNRMAETSSEASSALRRNVSAMTTSLGRLDGAQIGIGNGNGAILNGAGLNGMNGGGGRVVNFNQRIEAITRPEDIVRVTRRKFREFAVNWDIEDGRIVR